MLLYENVGRFRPPLHILYTRYITRGKTSLMVYLMTLFAEWPELMGCPLPTRLPTLLTQPRVGRRSLSRTNYEQSFLSARTKHPIDPAGRMINPLPSCTCFELGLGTFRATLDSIYHLNRKYRRPTGEKNRVPVCEKRRGLRSIYKVPSRYILQT